MGKKFCADDAKKLTRESVGFELEDRDSNFAWILEQIKEVAAEWADSMQFADSDLFTMESLWELSNRGFTLIWVPDQNPAVKPSIRVVWESEDE